MPGLTLAKSAHLGWDVLDVQNPQISFRADDWRLSGLSAEPDDHAVKLYGERRHMG